MKMAYWVFILCSAIFTAYTMVFQRATLFWGKKIAPDNKYLPAGLQDAITPKWQTIRNVVVPFLFIGSAVGGIILFRWYMALVGPLVLVLISTTISGGMLPKPDSMFFKDRILKSLNRRLDGHRRRSEEQRILAMEEIIKRMEGSDIIG